jgi:hypothetical protein
MRSLKSVGCDIWKFLWLYGRHAPYT